MPRRSNSRGGFGGNARRRQRRQLMSQARQESQSQSESEFDQSDDHMSVDENQPDIQADPSSLVAYDETWVEQARMFDDELRSISINECSNCHRKFPGLQLANERCSHCRNDPVKFSITNIVISPIPTELQGLTIIEQMLIAQVHPVVQLYRVRGAQFAFKGNVISFVQDIGEYFSILPLLPAQLAKVIMFTKNTPTGEANFRARRDKLLAALQWLKENNLYYRHITISRDNLVQIPEDGDMVRVLRPHAIDDPFGDAHEGESFVPLLLPVDQQRQIRQEFRLPYPATSGDPIDEFTSEGYIAKAFPCLFPDGRGDFLYPRLKQLTRHEYVNFLVQYHDRRFIEDKRFSYFMMNTMLRHEALTCSGIFVRRTALDGATAADIRQRMESNPAFLRQVMAYAAKLRSTRPYWSQRCGELLDMVDQLSTPTIFFTLSAADYHWPDLYRLLLQAHNQDPDTELSEHQRREMMHNNADLVAFFLQHRCQLFVHHVLYPIFGVVDHWDRFEWQWRGSGHMHGLLWFQDAPNVDRLAHLELMSEEEREIIRLYFDHLCVAINPNLPLAEGGTHPCRIRFSEVPEEGRLADLNQLLNYYQRHTQCGAHCLRRERNRPNAPLKCRFKFPIDTREVSAIEYVNYRHEFFPKRNDPLIGRYNAFVSQVSLIFFHTLKHKITFYFILGLESKHRLFANC